MEEKKSRYTPAQKRSWEKHMHEKLEDVRIRVPKGMKQQIKDAAETIGKSMNQYVLDLIQSDMKKSGPE